MVAFLFRLGHYEKLTEVYTYNNGNYVGKRIKKILCDYPKIGSYMAFSFVDKKLKSKSVVLNLSNFTEMSTMKFERGKRK